MFTGTVQREPAVACFDGNIVIFENRPFGIDAGHRTVPSRHPPLAGLPGRRRDGRRGDLRLQRQHRDRPQADHGYALGPPIAPCSCAGTPRMPDPVVKVGDWIADVTYERQQAGRATAGS